MLNLTPLLDIPLVQVGDDLFTILEHALAATGIQLENGDVIVIAQKIVSKAEGRFVNLAQVQPSPRALELSLQTEKDPRLLELVLRESNQVLRTRPGTIIVEHRLGFVCANAGIDHSNVGSEGEDWVLLLPVNPDASADALRAKIKTNLGVAVGVLIIDSHGRAWRLGTHGITIGLAGLPGVVDLRGEPDLFGRRLQITQVAAADELAGAASLMMGQGAEGTPIVHARGFPYHLRTGSLTELLRPHRDDLFR